jgi:uncharacterized membrane protein
VFSIDYRMVQLKFRFDVCVWVVTAVLLVWVLLILVSPLAVSSGTLMNLDGLVGIEDHAAVLSSLPQPWRGVYLIGDRLCHQREDRSFVVGGNEMAFCARCTGVWIGLVVGLVVMACLVVPVDSRLGWMVVVGLIPMAVDGGGQLVGWWVSTNAIRFVTGLAAGVVGGIACGLIVVELRSLVRGLKAGSR